MNKKQMETKEFKVFVPFEIKDDSSDTSEILKIKGYANYCGPMDEEGMGAFVDHCGDVMVPSGFDLKVWNKNPQIFWQHNRNSTCGKGIKATKKSDGLEIEAEVHKMAMDEKDWYKVKNGLVSYFSVGFRTLAGEWKKIGNRDVWFITKSLLLEVSIVSVPMNSESGFEIIKSFGDDGSFYSGELGEQTFIGKENSYKEVPTGDSDMKIKFKDTLSAEDVAKLKSLGLEDKLEETVEVDMKEFITGIVKAVVAEHEASKAAELEEATKKAKEEAEVKAAEEAFEKLAAELSVSLEEAKGLTEEQITEKRAAIADKVKEDQEFIEKMKAMADQFELIKKELTDK